MTYQDFAAANGFDSNAVKSLIDFMVERFGQRINANNVQDVLEAYIPEWLRLQESMAVDAHMHPTEFAGLVYDAIKS